MSCSTIPSAESEPLVLATTADRQQFLIESFRDPLHPTTLCTMSGAGFHLISRTEIGYVTNSSSNDPIRGTSVIWRMKLADLKPVAVVKAEGDVMDVAWSPDGTSVAYLLYTDAPGVGSGAANQLWLQTGDGSPRALTPPIPLFGRGVFLDDQILVRFSPDGKYVLMVDTFVAGGAPSSPDQAYFQIRSVNDLGLVWAAPAALHPTGKAQLATMAAWLHQKDRLYYRDPAGVQTWDPPAPNGTVYTGLAWYWPSISPDDRLVGYTVSLDAQPHVEVRELATKAFRVIPGIRGAPFFVTSSMLFVAEYAPSTQPGPGVPAYSQTGRAFVFDLRTNTETAVPMANLIDSWPR